MRGNTGLPHVTCGAAKAWKNAHTVVKQHNFGFQMAAIDLSLW